MHALSVTLILLGFFVYAAQGFRSIIPSTSTFMARQVVKDDVPARRNTLEELVQAFIEAIPSVLKPPKEMDKAKVIDDPPKFIKVLTYLRQLMQNYLTCTES